MTQLRLSRFSRHIAGYKIPYGNCYELLALCQVRYREWAQTVSGDVFRILNKMARTELVLGVIGLLLAANLTVCTVTSNVAAERFEYTNTTSLPPEDELLKKTSLIDSETTSLKVQVQYHKEPFNPIPVSPVDGKRNETWYNDTTPLKIIQESAASFISLPASSNNHFKNDNMHQQISVFPEAPINEEFKVSTTEIMQTDELFETADVLSVNVSKKIGNNDTEALPWWKRWPYPLRAPRAPCTCIDFTCGCCAGFELQRINISQQGCMNFTYDPDEFSLDMEMIMNRRSVYRNTLQGKNPPPLCIPLPIPTFVSFLPSVDFCARMFNVFTPGRNLHMCFDWKVRVNGNPLIVMQFDCVRVGANGLAVVKPGHTGGLDPEVTGPGDYGVLEGEEGEDYDPLDAEYTDSQEPNRPQNPNASGTPIRKPTKFKSKCVKC